MQWYWPGPVGEIIVERACQFICLLLDRRAIIPGSSVLFSSATLSFLTAQLNLFQLLIVSLLLHAPQGTQHQRRLTLDRWSDQRGRRGTKQKRFKPDICRGMRLIFARRAAEKWAGPCRDFITWWWLWRLESCRWWWARSCDAALQWGSGCWGPSCWTQVNIGHVAELLRGRTPFDPRNKWAQRLITYVS